MPRTSSDKLKLGLTYISMLFLSHECRSFSGGVTNCKSICNCGLMLPQVQVFFELEIKEFWKKSVHFSVRNDGAAIGDLFGKYLYPYSILESERVSCMFEIEEKHMEFCLPTLCHIFGLGQHAHAAARIILTDKKLLGFVFSRKHVCWT